MPYKDPNKQRDYQREWARKRRGVSSIDGIEPSIEWKLETIEDLKAVLESIISELMPSDLDIGVKARVSAQLINAGCKLLERSELEARMCAIEERLGITASQWR